MDRSRVALLVLLAVLLVVPLVLDRYLLSVMILILYFAFVGQAWNIMMGFCGQLSLGHALYVGLGAYTAAALFQHFGVIPWVGMLAAEAHHDVPRLSDEREVQDQDHHRQQVAVERQRHDQQHRQQDQQRDARACHRPTCP